jgi:hypothetical protein
MWWFCSFVYIDNVVYSLYSFYVLSKGNEIYFLFYFILQDLPHQTNIKLIQISTSALAGTDHRDKLQ